MSPKQKTVWHLYKRWTILQYKLVCRSWLVPSDFINNCCWHISDVSEYCSYFKCSQIISICFNYINMSKFMLQHSSLQLWWDLLRGSARCKHRWSAKTQLKPARVPWLTRSAAQAVSSQLLALRTHAGIFGGVFVDLWCRQAHVAAASIFTFLWAPVSTCTQRLANKS